MKHYGKELILDLHDCDAKLFNRKNITQYLVQLCKEIDMKRETLHFWDYVGEEKEYEKAPDHLKGTSAVQFISTSNITIHTLEVLKKVFINVFSYKDFDVTKVVKFSAKYFKGTVVNPHIVYRR